MSGIPRVLKLSELAELNIRRPESIQRTVDEERVAEIVAYQHQRIERGHDPVFPGILIVARGAVPLLSSDENKNDLWLLDGQHRWAAFLRLRELVPDCMVCIQEFRIGPGLPIAELFRLINNVVPVPEHLVDETVLDVHVQALNRFEGLFKARWKAFLSRSAQPRRPNVNLDHIKNVIYRARGGLLNALPTADALMAYLEWVNAELLRRYVSPELRERALQKDPADPLVLSHDVDHNWAEDGRWLCAYLEARPEDTPSLNTCAAVARGRVTQAMRRALWVREFGGRTAVGSCAACSGEILIDNWDAGHVRAVAHGGATDMQNLTPICRPCNLGMGTMDLHAFRAKIAPRSCSTHDIIGREGEHATKN
jgi:5-methylcytosine-specific restriction endonuclease McrA